MLAMLGVLLGLLEFLEFLTTSVGITVSFWISFYYTLRFLDLNLLWCILIPTILAIDLYCSLKQREQ